MRRLGQTVAVVLLAVSAPRAQADVARGLDALAANRFEDALQAFLEAFEDGDAEGAFYAGRLYHLGMIGAKDAAKAAGFYRLGADHGSARATYMLSKLYGRGDGVSRDMGESVRLACHAADAGLAAAQVDCGFAHADGTVVTRDLELAVAYYTAAADQDNTRAKHLLGFAYRDGRGVAQDLSRAHRLFCEVAATGHRIALLQLGRGFAEWDGVEQDLSKAYVFLRLATERNVQGASDAAAMAAAELTESQIETADARVRAWRPEEDAGGYCDALLKSVSVPD